MNKKDLIAVFFSLILSSFVFFVGYTKKAEPEELYRVYLKGETIGYIESKKELEEYIDNKQNEIKEKYKVEKVFLPNDLDIVKEITYGETASSVPEIYDKIKNDAPCTIVGFTITIKGTEEMDESTGEKSVTPDRKIYVVDRTIFEKSMMNTVFVFVSEANYDSFINKTQPEIKDTGSIIEDIYVKNQITITEGKISVEENIFTSVEELDKYLLYGTVEEQQKYKIKQGDTISNIAFKNKLSVEEFLIANPDYTSENNILKEGDEVNIGFVNPLFKVIEEDHSVEDRVKNYETKVELDENMLVGYEVLKQNGEDGLIRVTEKIQKVNGEIDSVVVTKTEVLKEAVPKIVIKGNKVVSSIGNPKVWKWPAPSQNRISSPYGYRWGKLHEGIDITGTGCGTPVYAANNGTVEVASWTSVNGNYIVINHNNGYYSIYAHMSRIEQKIVDAKKDGKEVIVEAGQVIGYMGETGLAYGCHLHFGISVGFPYYGGYFINPRQFYPGR